MKTFILATIIALCAVGVVHGLAGSYYTSTSNKWQDLAKISQELKMSLQKTAVEITSTAKLDNAVVGSSISETIYSSLSKMLSILDNLDDEIEAKTLTSKGADGMFQQLLEIFMECQEKIKPDVEQLSELAQTRINALLQKCGDTVTELTNAIKLILSGGNVGT